MFENVPITAGWEFAYVAGCFLIYCDGCIPIIYTGVGYYGRLANAILGCKVF